MSKRDNTIPMSIIEIKRMVGWKNFYNPFISLKSAIKKVSGLFSESEIAHALWSIGHGNLTSYTYKKHTPIYCSIIIFIFSYISYIAFPEVEKAPRIVATISLTILASCVAWFGFYLSFSEGIAKNFRRNKLHLSHHIRNTGHIDVDRISSMNVFEVMTKLRYAGFTESDIIELDNIMSAIGKAQNFANRYIKNCSPPDNEITVFPKPDIEVTKFTIGPQSVHLLQRATNALGLSDMLLPLDYDKENMTPYLTLQYAGVSLETLKANHAV